MDSVFGFAREHPGFATFIAGVVMTPAVTTMPDKLPRSLDDWWLWFFDYAHQIANVRNTRLVKQPIPTPPATGEAASPKA